MPIDEQQCLNGESDALIDYDSLTAAVHKQVVQPFLALQADALDAGFELAIASGYRSFERQLAIWNDKATARRPVLDSQGRPLDISTLSEWQLCQAILRWSALPGASRHHWGSDIDIYDRRAVAKGYQVQLTAAEVADDGPFGPMHQWLDQQLSEGFGRGFFRPYQNDTGGIAPERWHLSYAQVAVGYQRSLSPENLLVLLEDKPLQLKPVVRDNIDEIYRRFIDVPFELYPPKYQQAVIEK
jgi:LAS superfamily LD-carboxypeptidase LdcB